MRDVAYVGLRKRCSGCPRSLSRLATAMAVSTPAPFAHVTRVMTPIIRTGWEPGSAARMSGGWLSGPAAVRASAGPAHSCHSNGAAPMTSSRPRSPVRSMGQLKSCRLVPHMPQTVKYASQQVAKTALSASGLGAVRLVHSVCGAIEELSPSSRPSGRDNTASERLSGDNSGTPSYLVDTLRSALQRIFRDR